MRVAFLKPPIGGILGLEMLTFVEPLGPPSPEDWKPKATNAGFSISASRERCSASRRRS